MSTSPPSRGPDSPENPHAGQGSVTLDIGGDIGALVVKMPESTIGSEVEIQPEGVALKSPVHDHDHGHDAAHGHGHGHGHGLGFEDGYRPHVAVVRRPMPSGGEIPSLVFPELLEGRYELMDKGSDEVRMTVEIVGGEVTMSVWPT